MQVAAGTSWSTCCSHIGWPVNASCSKKNLHTKTRAIALKGTYMQNELMNDVALIRALKRIHADEKLHTAAIEFLDLQDRNTHPDGKFDNAGRFYLRSKCSCCDGLRAPSRLYPMSEMAHGRTALHVAHARGMPERLKELKAYSGLLKKYPPLRESVAISQSLLSWHAANKVLAEIRALEAIAI